MSRTYWLAWLLMPVIGIVNGAFRVMAYQETLGNALAHQLSCLTGILLFGLYVWFINRRWPFASGKQALIVGLTWMILTIAFELGFGMLMGNSFSALVADYNVLAGHLWPLVLFTIGFAPYMFYRFSGHTGARIQHPAQ
jgi:hypothetical protein